MTELLGAKVNDAGELIFDPDPKARKVFFEEFYRTPEGQEFLEYRSPGAIARVAEVVERLYSDDAEITIPKFCAAVRMLLDTKDPAVIPAEDPTRPAREHRPNGTFKSEFEGYCENNSMDAIRERARSDAEFGRWFNSQRAVEGTQQGAYLIAGTPTRRGTAADRNDPKLQEFARLYNTLPTDRLKPRGGVYTLAENHRYKVSEFEEMLERANACGLLF